MGSKNSKGSLRGDILEILPRSWQELEQFYVRFQQEVHRRRLDTHGALFLSFEVFSAIVSARWLEGAETTHSRLLRDDEYKKMRLLGVFESLDREHRRKIAVIDFFAGLALVTDAKKSIKFESDDIKASLEYLTSEEMGKMMRRLGKAQRAQIPSLVFYTLLNRVRQSGLLQLSFSSPVQKIVCYNAPMDEAHATTLSRVLRSPASPIVSLVLSNIPMRTRSVVALASSLCPGQSRLEVLVLEGCSIGSVGAAALAEALAHNTRLSKLDLSRNHIGDSACPWLCNALLTNETLRVLVLNDNAVTDRGALTFLVPTLERLAAAPASRLELVALRDNARISLLVRDALQQATTRFAPLGQTNMAELSPVTNREQIAILDFGSQYSHLIARRVRELHVFCELYSCLVEPEELKKHKLKGIIFSGGPNSVFDEGSPHVHPGVWKLIEEQKLPVLGICYGLQELAFTFNGAVAPCERREYGKAIVHKTGGACGGLFDGLPDEFQMWMSHGDKLTATPEGFVDIAYTENSQHAAIVNVEKRFYGIQFHPEVTHSPLGKDILKNFVVNICGAPTDWDMRSIADAFIEDVRNMVGPDGHVIGAVSGGVDSSVAAVLLQRALGDRFHAVLIDNGLLRKDESTEVVERLQKKLGINLKCIDASDRFLKALAGVTEPETKRKTIGNLFIEIFQEEAKRIGKVDFLLQGTLYPDVIESISYKGPSATIKTHHNVGGLPEKMDLKLIEPLRELFKDEVRELGMALGIDEESVWRHPFPGPGLAIRVLGEVTKEALDTLRQADAIFLEELRKNGHYKTTGQAFCVLLPVKSVGVMGDGRTYEKVVAIRAVSTSDYMTADWYHMPYEVLGRMSNRIINEVRGVNRVVYDISSKPPATIEWE
ncbi:hypothetical protein P43SY_004877 [Pythium insidiosum]|uniref:GMP synthase [glutamine-hydrolyzing] n=1 Tax=Pythium insidiosum TaxID=114742 RepID=A0AAD5LJK5_PYTIN|nr:hypothetical protein P43SY_004877 [Pythium insidiosum]